MMTSDLRSIHKGKGPISLKLVKKDIRNYSELVLYLSEMPYGRLDYGNDLSLIIDEDKGTCSTKHALIRKVGYEQSWEGLSLMLCIYKMSKENTPGIGNAIKTPLFYLPEAHCVIRDDDQIIDITTKDSDFKRIESDVLDMKEITPDQIGNWKVTFHREFLKKWLSEENLDLSFDEIWKMREECILNLSNLMN